jgi:spore germination cell wall hydrolase CwlJ-like protein
MRFHIKPNYDQYFLAVISFFNPRRLRMASAVCTAMMIAPGVVYATKVHLAHEEQLGCLAKNIYYEARGEPVDAQKVVAYVTIARAADRKEWGRTPCETVFQRIRGVAQFSWVPHHEAPKGPQWDTAKHVAQVVYADPVAAIPKKLKCARYYKRTDNAGVSERSKVYFATLKTADRFGNHTAYCDKR